MANPSSAPATPIPGYEYDYFRITRPHATSTTAHVEIDRRQKLNAFVPDMWREFGAIFRRLGGEATVRAVVLSGAGDRAFTTGLDVGAAAGELRGGEGGMRLGGLGGLGGL
ncbi:enoyl-CoA hydratase/isomerase family protein [Ophiocordyceps camponoti-floridani]|uniref:Enoyl-CoA hydratase/isomerase family protein n=1 Tax=Ophiocordyceps camponoti-floridani TaxID=2030778 RepID=A0A8H4Q9K2_9HYPO|nr:enoyl-CoA hydratase/isomerase family protein [Ophiocordyceps camponoti-floridani]